MANIFKQQDNWNAHLYDDKHFFVTKFGESLIELLQPQFGERILDVGCGTGDLANKLAKKDVSVVGVDNSVKMIQQAKQKYPHISFQVENALDLPFIEEFDAVFSNAALHWIKQPEHVLRSIFQSLKPGGRFVAELGAKGNIKTMTDAVKKQCHQFEIDFNSERFPWYFPSVGEYTTLMEHVGFEVSFAYQYPRPTPLEGEEGLRNWFEMFGSSLFEGVPARTKEEMLTNIELALKDTMFVGTHWLADYIRIRVVGVKKT